MENAKKSLAFAGILGAVGLVLGVIAGWWGVFRADGAEAVAGKSAPVQLALALLLPVALAVIVRIEQVVDEAVDYATLKAALIRLFPAGVAGSIFANLLFLYGAFQIPVIFGGEDPTQMIEALRPKLFDNALVVIAVTAVGAVIVAVWAQRRTPHD